MELTAGLIKNDACWAGYVQKGVKRKGNRTVPNCVPVGKAKKEMKRKTGDDIWADGFAPRADKKCGNSGIPENAQCTKTTRAKVESTARKVGEQVKNLTVAASFLAQNKGAKARLSQIGAAASLIEAGATYSAGRRTGNSQLKTSAQNKAKGSALILFRAAQTTSTFRKSQKSWQKAGRNLEAGAFKFRRNLRGGASAQWSRMKDRSYRASLENLYKRPDKT